MQTQNGEITRHLIGIFYRTIRLISNGIKPVYVFDGKPPDMKMGELVKRSERRAADFERALSRAVERGEVDTFEKNIVQVTREHFDEVKRLLTLMGVPLIEAPSEAEAQCAELVKGGKVHASVTEDMDALAFGSNILLRNIFGDETRKFNVKEFNLKRVLDEMKLTMNQFIDFCILLGCDYCGSIRGIGPKKAFELIKQFQSIEVILENIDTERYIPPENWPYAQARELLMSPDVISAEQIQLQWKNPDIEGVVEFMCREKNFE
ncbi:hypothetical protein WR25_07381 [Diploscapter pachys]|uniref:Flap endonuclease 1 n=1 Tax=Diploscapter pachys TaxID=2018661 RepID=A0A2A2JHW1_9BILA|nr:hypothetical protein WR25_07381 [Diploscapter pachys]